MAGKFRCDREAVDKGGLWEENGVSNHCDSVDGVSRTRASMEHLLLAVGAEVLYVCMYVCMYNVRIMYVCCVLIRQHCY